ncbi:MAG: fibronectin type III domain-containing protein, partial [SAR202 cluster bacterium]|nr:fibronectin type III domain-containing protein [SAR202 cluster bacterium]
AAKTFAWETTNDTLASSLQSTGSLNNVVISNLTVDTQYYYIFYASNNVGGLTNWSAINQAFASALTGKSLTDLAATAITSTEIELTWTDSFNTETGYVIERSPDGSSWASLDTTGADASNYTDSGLSESVTYHYRIAATNAAGVSDWSSAPQVTTPSRPRSIATDFSEATYSEVGLLRDIPSSGLASITLDDANDRLVFATTGNTDMWATRNNAPIGYILKPTGPLWFMQAEIELATTDNGQVFGLTVYEDTDGAKPDFTYGLDYWNPANPMVKLQGLQDNNPDINVSAAGATRVILRIEVEDDAGGAGIARYTLKYDLLGGSGMQTLTTYDSGFSNARVGVALKTNTGRTTYIHDLEIDNVGDAGALILLQ